MKIATYNIWNSSIAMPEREGHIIEEINSINADILVLQEVRDKGFSDKIYKDTNFKNHSFHNHSEEEEGLMILSKHKILSSQYCHYALIAEIEYQNNIILIASVHFPWKSVLKREYSIINIIAILNNIKSDYKFILGDFNCSPSSNVYRYLAGDISLNNTEASPYWTDLAKVSNEYLGIQIEVTLDLKNNPRWKEKPITDISKRFDYIFIHDCFPKAYPYLNNFKYFGKKISNTSKHCPSDHYGILADLKMPFE